MKEKYTQNSIKYYEYRVRKMVIVFFINISKAFD